MKTNQVEIRESNKLSLRSAKAVSNAAIKNNVTAQLFSAARKLLFNLLFSSGMISMLSACAAAVHGSVG
jgi:hypothetical protein